MQRYHCRPRMANLGIFQAAFLQSSKILPAPKIESSCSKLQMHDQLEINYCHACHTLAEWNCAFLEKVHPMNTHSPGQQPKISGRPVSCVTNDRVLRGHAACAVHPRARICSASVYALRDRSGICPQIFPSIWGDTHRPDNGQVDVSHDTSSRGMPWKA